MPSGSHTYWKNPGEAGVPPVFTFNGSENVSATTVLYPAPQRISEEGIDAFGYTDQVVFPVMVTPTDPTRPSKLHVDVTYAVCNTICLPGHSTASIDLRPHGAGESAGLVSAALAKVPQPDPADAAALVIVPRKAEKSGADPSWILTWTGHTTLRDIIPDAPEGYYFATKKTQPDVWRLTATQTVATGQSVTVPVTFVLIGADGATQLKHIFDVGPKSVP